MKNIVRALFFIFLSSLQAQDNFDLYSKGKLTLRALTSESYAAGNNQKLIKYLQKQIKPTNDFREQKKNLEIVSVLKFLELVEPHKVPKEIVAWILDSEPRFYEFTFLVKPADDVGMVFKIIRDLYKFDDLERDDFSKLIFAFAVVWDQKRPLIHNFMGGNNPAYEENLTERYQLLKTVYKKRSPIDLKHLSAGMLVYVVDLPIPVAEIKWALENEKGRASSWGQKFDDVKYDEGRFSRNQFSWNSGEYTFAGLREKGGICIDQAYYTAMTARCWGIPSMIFTGKGRRGGHAWIGLMRSASKWTMDIGRYNRDNYSAGKARNPQTNQLINDHELALIVSPEFFSADFLKAQQLNELADFFIKLSDNKTAMGLLVEAVRSQPLLEHSWLQMATLLKAENKLEEVNEVLKKQALAFRRYEDKLISIYNRQIEVLEKLGRAKDAEYIRKGLIIKMRNRDDLLAEATSDQAEEFISAGKKEEARDVYEKYIRLNAKEGYKIIEVVESYLEVMERTKQLEKCTRFLKSMSSRVPKESRGWMEAFLVEAYEKNGDTEEAKDLKEKMKKSKADIGL